MAVTKVTYNNNKALIGVNLKPVADIVLIGPKGKISISIVLVDTGADYLMIPDAAARRIGWLPAVGASTVYVRTAGGTTVGMTRLSSQPVEIEGKIINCEILIGANSSPALIGRNALRMLVDIGFNTTDWMW